MPSSSLNPEDFQNSFHWAQLQQNGTIPSFATRPNDPYKYQPGFGNSFESEAIPGTIPRGQNNPRSIRFGLYAEQITASAFVAPRHLNKKAWLYRSRPAVAHQGFVRIHFVFLIFVFIKKTKKTKSLRGIKYTNAEPTD
jgi:homogentisate 1,2-dioxygenase